MKYAALLGLLAIGFGIVMTSSIHAQVGTLQPSVGIVDPISGETVATKCPVYFWAAGNGLTRYELYVDGSPRDAINVSKSNRNSFLWNNAKDAAGLHTISVKVYDKAGNSAMSSVDCIAQ